MRHPDRVVSVPIAVGVLLASSAAARRKEVSRTEERVFRLVNDAPDGLHVPIWAAMQSGSLAAVFVASNLLRKAGRSRSASVTLVAGVSVWAGVKAVKPLVGRGRPTRHLERVAVRGNQQSGLGYPSGHAAVATTLAVVTASHLRPGGRLVAAALAATTGGARIYVGAHLPLDVIGGAAIGVLSGRAATVFLNAPKRR